MAANSRGCRMVDFPLCAQEAASYARSKFALTHSSRFYMASDIESPGVSPAPAVTAVANRDPDPLGSFLASLRRLRALPEDTLVLPSHGVPFYGLRQRVDDLTGHHREQLDKLAAACTQ